MCEAHPLRVGTLLCATFVRQPWLAAVGKACFHRSNGALMAELITQARCLATVFDRSKFNRLAECYRHQLISTVARGMQRVEAVLVECALLVE